MVCESKTSGFVAGLRPLLIPTYKTYGTGINTAFTVSPAFTVTLAK